ncbi:MAG: DUF3489 domain-containing protein [Hyphomicrobium sp.]
MTSIEARYTTPAKRANSAMSGKPDKLNATGKKTLARPAAKKAEPSDERHLERVTKRDRILELLSRRDGATITEIMEICDWQQHSVRGFLAGTVKKKLGLTLTSSKPDGETRRYRIAVPRRGR